MPSRDGDERNGGGIVADLLDEVADLLGDLLIPDDDNIIDDLDVSERVGREFVKFYIYYTWPGRKGARWSPSCCTPR